MAENSYATFMSISSSAIVFSVFSICFVCDVCGVVLCCVDSSSSSGRSSTSSGNKRQAGWTGDAGSSSSQGQRVTCQALLQQPQGMRDFAPQFMQAPLSPTPNIFTLHMQPHCQHTTHTPFHTHLQHVDAPVSQVVAQVRVIHHVILIS